MNVGLVESEPDEVYLMVFPFNINPELFVAVGVGVTAGLGVGLGVGVGMGIGGPIQFGGTNAEPFTPVLNSGGMDVILETFQ
jgi:hypothetical protein